MTPHEDSKTSGAVDIRASDDPDDASSGASSADRTDDAMAPETSDAVGSGDESNLPAESGDGAEGEAPDEPSEPARLARLTNVSRSYGMKRALGPVSFDLEPGCLGLLGPNGAGKSTLLRILMGLLTPSEGSVEILGEHPSSKGLRRRIGYVPEGDAAFPHLSGVQAVSYAGRLVGMDPASAVQRAHQVLDYVNLGEARYRAVEEYSTGMRQRLKIAQALVHDPELLVLDEPTEGVDPEAREDILALISELSREHGLQVILSTHLLHDVERVATHALILNDGKVVEHGPVASLRTAQDRGIEVRLNAAPEPLMERLVKEGVEHQWLAPSLRVATADAGQLLRWTAEAGLVVRHLSPVELSLNEVFEEAVSGRIPVTEAPAADADGSGAAADVAADAGTDPTDPAAGEVSVEVKERESS